MHNALCSVTTERKAHWEISPNALVFKIPGSVYEFNNLGYPAIKWNVDKMKNMKTKGEYLRKLKKKSNFRRILLSFIETLCREKLFTIPVPHIPVLYHLIIRLSSVLTLEFRDCGKCYLILNYYFFRRQNMQIMFDFCIKSLLIK